MVIEFQSAQFRVVKALERSCRTLNQLYELGLCPDEVYFAAMEEIDKAIEGAA